MSAVCTLRLFQIDKVSFFMYQKEFLSVMINVWLFEIYIYIYTDIIYIY